MPCFHPLQAFQTASGEVVFYERSRFDVVRSIQLPCGQCVGCRLERSRQWAMRCLHEASLYDANAFVTLTYDDENLPADGSLNYDHFQKFMKRLRKRLQPVNALLHGIRFYMCGEYGDLNFRPHYHACLFNCDFPDKQVFKDSAGVRLYTSGILESLWPFGLSSVGDVTFESAAYVARYCVAKVTGFNASEHYRRFIPELETIRVDMSTGELYSHELVPEFNRMSLKPGIGAPWLARWKTDVYPHDYVVINGKEVKPPKYYDTLFSRDDPDSFEEIKWNRELDALSRADDNTDERLAVKEQVTTARLSQLKRSVL